MAQTQRWWRSVLMPFLVSGGLAFGALLGQGAFSETLEIEGPTGDLAGARAALLVFLCVVVGFGLATVTVVTATLRGRGAPDRLLLRLGGSLLCGGVLGGLAESWSVGATGLAWALLLLWPVLGSWPWRRRTASAAGTGTPEKP